MIRTLLSLLISVTAAPSVVLHGPNGAEVKFTDYRGNVVLVDFWASWCAPCKASLPALDALYSAEHAHGLEVVAINVDERRKDADAFLRGKMLTLPIFFDSAGEVPMAFGVTAMPSSFLIDRTGVIRFSHIGYSTKVLESYRKELALLLSEARSS